MIASHGRRFFMKDRSYLNHLLVHSIVLTVVVVLIYSPLLSTKLIEGHDLFFHQRRSVEYLEALKHSPNLLPIWSENAIGGLGRPFFLYAAPLVQMAGAALIAVTGNSSLAIHLLALFLALLGTFGILFWLRELAPPHVAFLATLSFVGTDYVVRNILSRGALAEVMAMSFFTITLWLIERYLRTGRTALLAIASGFFGLVVLAHNLSVVFLAPALMAYTAFGGWRYERWRRAFVGLGVPILGMAAAAFFWVPSIGHSNWIDTQVHLNGHGDVRGHFLHIGELFRIGFTTLSNTAPRRFLTAVWTLSAVLGLFLFFFRSTADKRTRRFMITLTIALALCLFFLSVPSQPIWMKAPYLRYLQFPWRLLVLSSIFCAGLSTYLFSHLRWYPNHVFIGILVVVLPLLSAIHFGYVTPRESRPHLETPEAIRKKRDVSFGYNDVSAPRCVKRGGSEVITPATTFQAGRGVHLTHIKLRYAQREAHYQTAQGGVVLLRSTYFPLWSITANGTSLETSCVGRGFLRFVVPPGKGIIKAVVRPSKLMLRTRWISLFVWLSLLFGALIAHKKRWEL